MGFVRLEAARRRPWLSGFKAWARAPRYALQRAVSAGNAKACRAQQSPQQHISTRKKHIRSSSGKVQVQTMSRTRHGGELMRRA